LTAAREIGRIRAEVEPVVDDVADLRQTVEPLKPATERLGNLAQRLPRRHSD